jgi:hypothetical protein
MLYISDGALFASPILINNMQFNPILLQYLTQPLDYLCKPPNVRVVLITIVLAKHVWVSDEYLVDKTNNKPRPF